MTARTYPVTPPIGRWLRRHATTTAAPPVTRTVPVWAPDGDHWTRNGQFWVMRTESSLILPVHYRPGGSRDYARALLADMSAAGADLVRVFTGGIPWATLPDGSASPYTAVQALQTFGAMFEDANAVGLGLQPVTVTDVEGEEEVADQAAWLTGRTDCLHELANEYWQRDNMTQEGLTDWGTRYCQTAWAVGAPEHDEPAPDGHWGGTGGPVNVSHLSRQESGHQFWNECLHLRDVYGIVEESRIVTHNNEQTGAAEPGCPGQRHYDPAWYCCTGIISRCFGLAHCFHSEDGRWSRHLEPNQRECRKQQWAGHDLVNNTLLPQYPGYYNTGHQNSPVANIPQDQWESTLGTTEGRCHSFLTGNVGVTYVAGLPAGMDFPVPWQNGWAPTQLLAEIVAAHDGSRLLLYEIRR